MKKELTYNMFYDNHGEDLEQLLISVIINNLKLKNERNLHSY